MKPLIFLLFANSLVAETQPYRAKLIPAGYSVETIVTPVDATGAPLQFGVGGLGFTEAGDAFVASRTEGIWKYSKGSWSRFSDHLHDPQGLHVVDEDTVIIAQKPELTRVQDTDGDGLADLYQTICDDWRYGGNYCEYVHGPVVDSRGNFYLNLNLSAGSADMMFLGKGKYMGSSGGYDGWHCKVTPEGDLIPVASGLRSPAGIGINSETDEVFYTENQGSWVPTSFLAQVKEGAFYGYPSSLIDDPKFRGKPEKIVFEEFSKLREMPAVYFPHGELANSPGDPVFDITEGHFGPFAGQLFVGCQTRSNIMRVSLEKVKGEYQGSVFNFIDHLQSGCLRLNFDPQGRLWVGQTGRGWGSVGGKTFGLQRISWDGKTTPFEVKAITLNPDGFRVSFTKPCSRDGVSVKSLAVSSWRYHYHSDYGSPKVDTQSHEVESVTLAEDGLSLDFKTKLLPGRVYKVTLTGVAAQSGESMSTDTGYYTLNNLVD